MGRGANTPSFPIPAAPNPNYLHTTTYGSRVTCNPGKPGTPPKTPVEGAIVPGSVLPINPLEENHSRFWGIGGAQAEPSLLSRGMPRSMVGPMRASDRCDGWEINYGSGRGFAGEKGRLPRDHNLSNENHLGELVAVVTKDANQETWKMDPDKFLKCAQLTDVPVRSKAIERHKRRNPTHSRQQIRFHPLLERGTYESLLRPGTNSTNNTGMQPARSLSAADGHFQQPPMSAFGKTQSTLRTSPSQGRMTSRTLTTLGSGMSHVTDVSQFSRLSVASQENRALREENRRLAEELSNLKGGASTGRGSVSSFASARSRLSRKTGGSHKSNDPGALAQRVKTVLETKFGQLKDAFRHLDQDKSSGVTVDELAHALLRLNVATESDIAKGRVKALFKRCDVNGDGQIAFSEFAHRMKSMETGGAFTVDNL